MTDEVLDELCRIEDKNPGWWFYPSEAETNVRGFRGTGKIFIVGIRPSMSEWDKDHVNRRAFYNLLSKEDAGDCHTTDFFKRRGDLRESHHGIPNEHDFDKNLAVLKQEFKILEPSAILAMGQHADDFLRKYKSEYANYDVRIIKIWHFGSVWHGKQIEFESSLIDGLRKARNG